MKMIFIFLMLPLFSTAQTVHIKNDTIVYEGKVKIANLSGSEIFKRIQESLALVVGDFEETERSDHSIKGRGKFKLQTPYNIKRSVRYTIQMKPTDEGYDYLIDSVSLEEQIRGEKPVIKSSAELIETMSEAGKIVGDTEKLLNQIDMNFQKLLVTLRYKISSGVNQK
jgi:hypothetical protein